MVAKTDYIIEQHSDEYIRINFDITMTRLSCDLASLDVVNQMGTHKVVFGLSLHFRLTLHRIFVDGKCMITVTLKKSLLVYSVGNNKE